MACQSKCHTIITFMSQAEGPKWRLEGGRWIGASKFYSQGRHQTLAVLPIASLDSCCMRSVSTSTCDVRSLYVGKCRGTARGLWLCEIILLLSLYWLHLCMFHQVFCYTMCQESTIHDHLQNARGRMLSPIVRVFFSLFHMVILFVCKPGISRSLIWPPWGKAS